MEIKFSKTMPNSINSNTIPYFVEKPWGGYFLSELFKLAERKKLGEAWIISTLDEGESQFGNSTLSQYLGEKLPFLIKIIDAAENLSVQVHPNDIWAKKLENSTGKTECWYILKVQSGAGIYLGLKPYVTLEMFFSRIKKQESVEEFMNFIPVEDGDFIEVPAGTIHAIGSGVTLLEIQQASGITYRLWDWGRAGRELHLEKGELVSFHNPEVEVRKFDQFKAGNVFYSHPDFDLQKIDCESVKCFSAKAKFSFVINLKTFKIDLA